MSMDTAVRDRWISALRSGNYEQGRKLLKIGNKYCCLGVLCEIEGEPIDIGQEMPSDAFFKHVGLRWSTADYYAGQNDQGVSFAAIADKIERGA